MLVLRSDTQAGGLTFSARQQKDSRGIQTEILHTTLDLLLNYCFPASSSLLLFLPLSHTLIVWVLFSPPSVSLSLSPPLALPLSPLSHSHTLSLFLEQGNQQKEGAAWMLCLWGRSSHVDRDTAIVYHTPFLSLSPSLSLSHTHTPADTPKRSAAANGNSSPGRLRSPHQERADQKLQPVLRGQGYKTVSRFSLFKNNWPLWPSSSRAFSYHDTRGGGVQVGWVRGIKCGKEVGLNVRLNNSP